jgi:hypothetical protein
LKEDDKARLHISISRKTAREWRKFIYQTGYKKGDLSKWNEKALIKFMSLYNNTQQHCTQNLNDAKDEVWKVRQVWQNIIKYILDKHGYQLEKNKPLPVKMYLDALHNVRGTDKRTEEKWTNLFTDAGYFKKISLGAFQVLDRCYEFDTDITQISEKEKEELK